MNTQKRQKASDVFADSNLLFRRKGTFEEAFPQIEDITIEVEETDFGMAGSGPNSRFTKDNIKYMGEYVDCSNPLCYNGGVAVGSLIKDMIYSKQPELETTEICKGYEGSPKGRRKYGDCLHMFKVKIQIKYKNDQ